MPVKVQDIYDIIDEFAPFNTQEEWDNAGILAGSKNAGVARILCALDLTQGVIDEAVRLDAELIVTHHPILFHARKNLTTDDPEGLLLCSLARSGKALIAAHTNFDKASGGVNCVLAQALGLEDIKPLEGGLRIGTWKGTFARLCENVASSLNCVVRPYGDAGASVQSVAVCGGAGGSLWKMAREAGADAYVTGEIHHNDALDMTAWGLVGCEAGHFHTENPSVKAMKTALQNRLDELQYDIMVFNSDYKPF
ncbi:MAG: Nif3-like dinuclear metal center hexameric protein [Clostridia bacterium]|nr:Nif3-like dinuclear metal center hexameric protein [Clostridia bacterium]